MFFLKNLFTHLFPVNNFVPNIFLSRFNISWCKEQSNNIGIHSKWLTKHCSDGILTSWYYLCGNFCIHDDIMFKIDTITTFS